MIGIDIFDLTLLPAMTVALLAGVLSFLSPCVLPIVPPYLAYMGGISMAEMREEAAGRRRVMLSRCSSSWGCRPSSCSSASPPRPSGGSS
jgi:cytochrome c-type biogenesis protein